MSQGVSVVICCHNSAKRLPPTLAHLAAQQGCDGIPWEVIVIDNASQDETARLASALWPKDAPAPLRVFHEPRLGLAYARQCGFAKARYEIVSFVDDDNWVAPDWVRKIWQIMTENPKVAACGGSSEPVFESKCPWWFETFKISYAVGHQVDGKQAPCEAEGLWGPGGYRKSAWLELLSKGFRPILVGRQGQQLTSSEDIEFNLALRLAGWRLWYDPDLKFRHFLPSSRLEWRYLLRLQRGIGFSSIGLDPYWIALQGEPKTPRQYLERTWQWQLLAGILDLRRFRRTLMRLLRGQDLEGDYYRARLERHIGRLQGLLRHRDKYNQWVQEVRMAPWRRVPLRPP